MTVKFARQETDVAKKAREKSYEALTLKVNEEQWNKCTYYPSDSDQSEVSILYVLV